LIGLAALAAPPVPDATTPIRVSLEAPPGCGNVDTFYASVLARSERARRADANENAVRLEVRLTRVANKVHGELRLVDEGRTDLRRVDGATCEEVAEALSLTAALALVASPRGLARVNPAGSNIAAAPATSSGSGTAPSPPSPPPASPALPLTTALPVPVGPAPSPVSGRPVDEPSEPVVPAHPEVDAATPPAVPHDDAASPLHLEFGLGPAVGRVLSPGGTLGGAISARLARDDGRGRGPSAGLALVHLRNDLLLPTPDVAVTWTALALTVCPGWGFHGAITVEGCGLGVAGWLTAAERAVTVRTAASRTWWSVGAVLRVRAALGRGLYLQADAALHVPLIARKFITTTPAETVAESTRVAGMLGLSLTHSL
jgi:hypothetical protein